MYTKHEAAAIREKFWTSFGKYLAPIPSSTGNKINWINYKTGVKDIRFKMDATNNAVHVSIDMIHKIPDLREKVFQLFYSLRSELEIATATEWNWVKEVDKEGEKISQIISAVDGLSVLNEAYWPAIISFLKPRIIGLDAFWAEYKEIFETLS